MSTQRRRIYVPWHEFERLAVSDFETVGDGGSDCLPVRADEVMVHTGTSVIEPRIVLHSRRCGTVAVYRPGLRATGEPFVQRIRSVVDGERCEQGHRLCCPGQHPCSLCVNDLAEALSIDWASLLDPEESWRRTVRRAKQMWQEGRAEIDRLEAAFGAPAYGPDDAVDPGHSSNPDVKDTDGPDSAPGVDPMVGD